MTTKAEDFGPVKCWRALRPLRFGTSNPVYGELVPEVGELSDRQQRILCDGMAASVEVVYVSQSAIDASLKSRREREAALANPEAVVEKTPAKKRVVRKAVKKDVGRLAESAV